MTVAVDHFAGLGWGVACHRLGITEYGVELAPSAIRMRSANGMRTIYRDVWAGLFHPWMVPSHRLYIASPPCQTFSPAGNGEGRRALDDVLTAIDERRHEDPARLHELTGMMDPRTALVLTPLAHIFQHRPELVALEQVPEVLPVWYAYANVLRSLGYSVWVGIMRAEQYGVPQTRKRAILVARLDGKVQPPTPTHSRYYSTDPGRLDPGVEKWVSMSEALGFGLFDRPSPTITSQAHLFKFMQDLAAWGRADIPAPTVAADPRLPKRKYRKGGERQMDGALRLTHLEAAALQTFPPSMRWPGNQGERFLAIGNAVPPLLAEAILGALLAPPAVRDAWDNVFAEVAG